MRIKQINQSLYFKVHYWHVQKKRFWERTFDSAQEADKFYFSIPNYPKRLYVVIGWTGESQLLVAHLQDFKQTNNIITPQNNAKATTKEIREANR